MLSVLMTILNRFLTACTIALSIAVFIFDMGDWTSHGIPLSAILILIIYASLIVTASQNLIFKPMLYNKAARVAKSEVVSQIPFGLTAEDALFMNSFIEANCRFDGQCRRVAVLIAVLVYVLLAKMLGFPITEYITLVILHLGPIIIVKARIDSFLHPYMDRSDLAYDAMKLYKGSCVDLIDKYR